MTTPGPEPEPGTSIGPYQVVAPLGRGSAGVVLKVLGPEPGPLALKLMHPVDGADRAVHRRFLHEARAMREVVDRHLVPLLDVGEWQGRPFLVMPLLTGGSIRDQLDRDGPLPVSRAVRVMVVVAAALGALHGAGIVHRDVKASNVVLGEDGDPMLADLGLARATDWTRLTGPGQVVGTLDHLAPEVLRGSPATVASDVYALGCLAFECLVGEPPFGHVPLVALMRAHQDETPVDPATLRADVPPELGWAILQALAKDPAGRPATAPAFGRLAAVGAKEPS